MNVLITGASGLLGGNLSFLWASKHQVNACFHEHAVSIPNCRMHQIDLLKENDVKNLFNQIKPGIVIHSAAHANVDLCEKNPDDAHKINVVATQKLAELSKKNGVKFVFVSTDSIFNENIKRPFAETDQVNPKSVYAKSKLEGERIVQSLMPEAVIIRTAFYGYNILDKFSLGEWVVNELKNNKSISGFDDVFFSPILANDLSEAIDVAVQKNLKGIYHVGAVDFISKYEFVRQISEIFGFSSSLIRRSSIQDAHLKAHRPLWTALNVNKFEKDSGLKLPSVREGIEDFYRLHTEDYPQQLKKCQEKNIHVKSKAN